MFSHLIRRRNRNSSISIIEGTILKEITFDKSLDDLLYQMANDKDVLGRRWAMGELEKMAKAPENKTKIVNALITSMEKDPFWRIRLAALSVVANIYSPDPAPGQERPAANLDANVTAALLRLTKDKESLIRGEALELLGETKDAKYSDLFLSALNDRSYAVIDRAALSIARVNSPKALDALVKLTNTPSWKGRIETAGLNGLAELKDKGGFDAAYKIATDPQQPDAARAAALSAIGATGKGDPRAFDLIFDKFKKALDATDYNGIFNGLNGLVNLADPKGQQAFDLAKEKFKGQANFLGYVNMFEKRFQNAIK